MPQHTPGLKIGLWSRTHRTEAGCWEFTGYRMAEGYGRIRHAGASRLAHRVAYALTRGDIPEGMIVRHICDNPPCVNPDHLELGSPADNMRDRDMRNRAARGERHGRSKITEADADAIRAARARGLSQQAIAHEYGVSQSQISRVTRGHYWKREGA